MLGQISFDPVFDEAIPLLTLAFTAECEAATAEAEGVDYGAAGAAATGDAVLPAGIFSAAGSSRGAGWSSLACL